MIDREFDDTLQRIAVLQNLTRNLQLRAVAEFRRRYGEGFGFLEPKVNAEHDEKITSQIFDYAVRGHGGKRLRQ